MTKDNSQGNITITTNAHMELVDITDKVQSALRNAQIDYGTCTLFNPHTTAGLTINEGADPDVQTDMIAGLKKIVPQDLNYLHMEGNSPSHIMATLLGSSLTILVDNGSLVLGTWQKIFFGEFDGPRNRKVIFRFSK